MPARPIPPPGARFQPELLDICAPTFLKRGLPADHGIEIAVTDDGQAWWAWRRTLPGLVFAIGQTARVEAGRYGDGNVFQWKYEGAEPPAGRPATIRHGETTRTRRGLTGGCHDRCTVAATIVERRDG